MATSIILTPEELATEEWRSIQGFPSYSVSSCGRIINNEKNKFLKQATHKQGYKQVKLYSNKVGITLFVHRLVAEAFLDGHGLFVDHINGFKHDNNISNLRLCTRRENVLNTPKLFLSKKTSNFKGVSRHKNKWRVKLTLKNGYRLTFGGICSETLAAKIYNEAAILYYGEFAYLNKIP